MKAVKFKEATKELAKPESMTDMECSSLWVFNDGTQCISKWKLNFRERMSALFFGTIWIGVISGYTQPPIWITSERTCFLKPKRQPIWKRMNFWWGKK
jgi:hypothetical protein